MTHVKLAKKFEALCHADIDAIVEWFPNGRDSIRVKFDDGVELVFTYYNDTNWRIEPIDTFLKQVLDKVGKDA